MHIQDLATETIVQIFLSAPTISTVVNLSATCRRFRRIFCSSNKLPILSQSAEIQYGPLYDITQLVTYREWRAAGVESCTYDELKGSHVPRDDSISETLIRSMIGPGRVVTEWEDQYPFKKWETDFQNRRSLVASERYKLRRALYRLWLYARIFHPMHKAEWNLREQRFTFLSKFSTVELAEMQDVHNMLRDTIGQDICPSRAAMRKKIQDRFPEDDDLSIYLPHSRFSRPPPPSFMSDYYHSNVYINARLNSYATGGAYNPDFEGWGDGGVHSENVRDMLKLDPGQILWLKKNCSSRCQVEVFIKSQGSGYHLFGDTFVETLMSVLRHRGEDWDEMQQAIDKGELGVALQERRDSAVQASWEFDDCNAS